MSLISVGQLASNVPRIPLSVLLGTMLFVGVGAAIVFLFVVTPIIGQEKVVSAFGGTGDLNSILSDNNKPQPIQPTGPVCGNQSCETGENNSNCLQDCFACNHNGACESGIGENTINCTADCSTPIPQPPINPPNPNPPGTQPPTTPPVTPPVTPPATCGDLVCQTNETCSNCASDCGACSVTECTDNGGTCQVSSCATNFTSYAAGNVQCPTGSVCCQPTAQQNQTQNGFFFDDYLNTQNINSATMTTVTQNGSQAGATSFMEPQQSISGEINPGSAIGQGLVGLWHLNGNANDSGPNALNGVLLGNPNCSATGKLNSACSFNGTTDTIRITDAPALNFGASQAFAISLWVNGGANLSQLQRIIDKRNSKGWLLQWDSASQKLRLRVHETASATITDYQSNPLTNSWHQLVLQRTPTQNEVWLDGVLNNSTADSSLDNLTDSAPLCFASTGCAGNPSALFAGQLDEIAIWNRNLSQAEITQLATAGQLTTSGSFESTNISTAFPIGSLHVHWTENGSGTSLEVSTNNGTSWCTLSNDTNLVSNSNCSLPANNFKYKINFSNSTQLDSIRFDYSSPNNSTLQTCGNNSIEGTELCDGTAMNNATCQNQGLGISGTLTCNSTCNGYNTSQCQSQQPPVCGNGQIQSPETCDDGDTTGGDGCSATCQTETGWTCNGQPSNCTQNQTSAVCGNGVIENGETCDQGNTQNGDGCSSTCQIETGYYCIGQPSTCQLTSSWQPPIGIPMPGFGLFEQAPATPNPWTVSTAGFYYIDKSASNCNDKLNNADTNGTPAQPRCTIPNPLPAGAVVEVHGVYNFVQQGNKHLVVGNGTPQQPIFVRGTGPQNMPRFTGELYPQGSHIIFENLDLDPGMLSIVAPNDHIVLRHSKAHNGTGSTVGIVGYANNSTTLVTDTVIFDNDLFDRGDWTASDEKDYVGVIAKQNSLRTWVLDNRIYHFQGDSVAVNPHGWGSNQLPPQFVYVGRNQMYENNENAIDIKIAFDVIVSQNTMYGFHVNPGPNNGSSGEAAAVHNSNATAQYPYPDRIWFLYNEMYDSDRGFKDTGSEGTYVIGNVIHDIAATGIPLIPNSGYSPGASIQQWGHSKLWAAHNTIYNTDLGIISGGYDSATTLALNSNIVQNLSSNYAAKFSGAQPFQLLIESGQIAAVSDFSNGVLYQNGGPLRIHWGNPEYTSLSAFQSATGKAAGSLQADAGFTNPAAGDFHLQSASPAKNTGAPDSVYDLFESLYPSAGSIKKDRDAIVRPQEAAWDMGAFEYH